MIPPTDRLIVALDVSSATQAQKIISGLGDSVQLYKVGMQLFTAEGPQIVRDLIASGKKVFLDLKYHDIPNTVEGRTNLLPTCFGGLRIATENCLLRPFQN